MDPVKDYPTMIFNLTEGFNYRYPGGINGPPRMVGIVFASPQSPLAKSDILPRIADWHCRSKNNTDFFFAGYEQHQDEGEGYVPVTIPGLENWQYSPLKFNEFRESLEMYTDWQYAGGCELILVDAIFDHQNNWAAIDFSAAVVCDLSTMKDEKAIESVEKFFESIFRYGDENGRALKVKHYRKCLLGKMTCNSRQTAKHKTKKPKTPIYLDSLVDKIPLLSSQ